VRAPIELSASDFATPEQFHRAVVEPCRPVVLRGLVAHWPVLQAARTAEGLRSYLAGFDAGQEADAFFGAPRIHGRYYYGEGLEGFNFERRRMRVADIVNVILSDKEVGGEAASVYLGSLPLDDYFPGFPESNILPILGPAVRPRIWLGHASTISCHYDTLDNVACVIAGTRRFTLYPPETIGDLYVGPIDHTMAGQPVSLAASSPPDDERFPRFPAAREQALEAELQPGDALYMPKLWWHQVESTGLYNGLVNYWWDATAVGPDAPYTALLLAMIAIAERPEGERRAWRAFFDHYAFRPDGHPLRHLPAERHGVLGPLQPRNYGAIRAWVMRILRGG